MLQDNLLRQGSSPPAAQSSVFQTTHFSGGGLSVGSKKDFTRLSSRVAGGTKSLLYVATVVTLIPIGVSVTTTSRESESSTGG